MPRILSAKASHRTVPVQGVRKKLHLWSHITRSMGRGGVDSRGVFAIRLEEGHHSQPQFSDESSKAQRSAGTCSSSHSYERAEVRCKPMPAPFSVTPLWANPARGFQGSEQETLG